MNDNEPISPYSHKNMDSLLGEIKEKGNLHGILLAFRDGGLISEVGEDGLNSIQFSAMCASVLESAEGLGKTIGEGKVGKIITELEEQSIIIVKCSKKTYLVLFFKDDSKVEFIKKNLDRYIQQLITALDK